MGLFLLWKPRNEMVESETEVWCFNRLCDEIFFLVVFFLFSNTNVRDMVSFFPEQLERRKEPALNVTEAPFEANFKHVQEYRETHRTKYTEGKACEKMGFYFFFWFGRLLKWKMNTKAQKHNKKKRKLCTAIWTNCMMQKFVEEDFKEDGKRRMELENLTFTCVHVFGRVWIDFIKKFRKLSIFSKCAHTYSHTFIRRKKENGHLTSALFSPIFFCSKILDNSKTSKTWAFIFEENSKWITICKPKCGLGKVVLHEGVKMRHWSQCQLN